MVEVGECILYFLPCRIAALCIDLLYLKQFVRFCRKYADGIVDGWSRSGGVLVVAFLAFL